MLEIIEQTSTHIEELSALQYGWHIDFTQLGPPAAQSAVSLIKSGNLGVCHFQFNSGFDQRLHAQPGYYSFGLPDLNTRGTTVQGNAAPRGAMVVFPRNSEAIGVSHAGFHGYGIHIRAAYLESIAETVFKVPFPLIMPSPGVHLLAGAEFGIIRRELAKWRQMSMLSDPPKESILETHAEELTLAILSGLSLATKIDEAAYLKSDRAIVLVMDYLNSRLSEEITAVELCTLADCSQRWLEQSFKTRFGVTPKAYVKCLRLARLRQDLLLSSDPDNKAINELASAYGFWHMGQLAADYRKVYGELPSCTLMRR